MKTSQLTYAAIGLCILLAIGHANKNSAITSKMDARSAAASLVDRDDVLSAKSRRRRSRVALQRVEAGCIPVSGPQGDLPITEDSPIGSPDGSQLAVGDVVCNSRGETAVIDLDEMDQTIATKSAAASPKDLTRYREHFDAILANLKKTTESPTVATQQDSI
jgi:hypothetical protein